MSFLLAAFTFSLAMSISPGPVNMIILSSGINHGVKKTIPYISGATIGFILLLIFIGLGIFQFISAYPVFLNYLAVGGAVFIIYIGYKIATSSSEIKVQEQYVPKFYQGFLLQWLNPKAWIAGVSGVSMFSSAESYKPFAIFVVVYFFVCYGSLLIWGIVGDKMAIFLNNPSRLRAFNRLMGLLLVATAIYMLYTHFI